MSYHNYCSFLSKFKCSYSICKRTSFGHVDSFMSLKCSRTLSHSCSKKWEEPDGFDTGIKIYHPLLKNKVRLILKNQELASWYMCGPTVYDSAHIGHASCFVKFDIIQRILRGWFDINLVTAMSITDIDKKIIKKSQDCHEDFRNITRHYEMEFFNDLNNLNVKRPVFCTRVTDYIQHIIMFVKTIMNQGYAYRTPDGSVYFDSSKLTNYGTLVSSNSLIELEENDGSEFENETLKKSAKDFALWKAHKPGEPFWESPWGRGVPGWHIECSTMASAIFGSNIDIHSGGIDLKFPHHENEEAQSCAYHSCKQWINYWMHSGHLHFKGDEKMSRSLKNVLSISDLLESYTADDFRALCLFSRYRNSMEFSEDAMVKARQACRRVESFLAKCQAYCNGQYGEGAVINEAELLKALKHTKHEIRLSFCDDFNTAKAMNDMMELISLTHKNFEEKLFDKCQNSITVGRSPAVIGAVQKFVRETLHDLGLTLARHKIAEKSLSSCDASDLEKKDLLISNIVDLSVDFRSKIRNTFGKLSPENLKEQKGEFFKISDNFRSDMRSYGIEVQDHRSKSSWSFVDDSNEKENVENLKEN